MLYSLTFALGVALGMVAGIVGTFMWLGRGNHSDQHPYWVDYVASQSRPDVRR